MKLTRELLEVLTPREEMVLRLRLGLPDKVFDISDKPHTLKEVGRLFGISRERIRQIETKALRKLRQSLAKRIEGTALTEERTEGVVESREPPPETVSSGDALKATLRLLLEDEGTH